MVIRREQINVFENKAQDDFVVSLKHFLRKSHGSVCVRLPPGNYVLRNLSDRILTELVRRAIEKGRRYSLTWQSSLAAFVTLMFLVAPNFNADPLINRMLTDSAIPSNERVDRICQWVKDSYWERVRNTYDPAAWVAPFAALRA